MRIRTWTTGNPQAAMTGKFRHVAARLVAAVREHTARFHETATMRALLLPKNPTGFLASHIVIAEENNGAIGIIKTSDVPHAAFVEYGTGRRGANLPPKGGGPKADLPEGWAYNPEWPGMAAIPYLYPSRMETEGPLLRDLQRILRLGRRRS